MKLGHVGAYLLYPGNVKSMAEQTKTREQNPAVSGVSNDFLLKLSAKIDNKTKPLRSLGRIESLAAQIACIQYNLTPTMSNCELTIFAADHGMANAGVSAFPQAVTRQMVLNFLDGGAASNVFCDALGIAVRVVDAGVAGEPIQHPNLISVPIAPGTNNAIESAAMTKEQCLAAIKQGEELASISSANAVCYGEMGIGNTSSASLLCHKLLHLSLGDITGAGTGLNADGIKNKLDFLRTASNRTEQNLTGIDALCEYGGFEIAMMVGAIIGSAANSKLIIVDGFIATAAAVVALNLEPTVARNLIYSHQSEERGHQKVLSALDAQPLLRLNLRLGEGTGALLAWPLVKSAAAMLNNMASFDSANISGPV